MTERNKENLKYKILIIGGFIALAGTFIVNVQLAHKVMQMNANPAVTNATMAKVYTVEEKIRENKHETFYAYDTQCNLLAEVRGNYNQVDIDETTVAKIAQHKNTVLTHNHPNQGRDNKTYPISLGDLVAASQINAKTIRAVGTTSTYEITRNGKKWQSPDQIIVEYNKILAEVDQKLQKAYNNKEVTHEYLSLERYDDTLEKLAVVFDLTYKRTDVK